MLIYRNCDGALPVFGKGAYLLLLRVNNVWTASSVSTDAAGGQVGRAALQDRSGGRGYIKRRSGVETNAGWD